MNKDKFEFKIKISHIVKFEEQTGLSILAIFRDQDNIKLSNLVKLAKCCSPLSDEEIDNFVEAEGINAFMNKLLAGLVRGGFITQADLDATQQETIEAEEPEKK